MLLDRLQPVAALAGGTVLLLIGLHFAHDIVAPVCCALVAVAVVWPTLTRLERHMARPLAILMVMLLTLGALTIVAGLAAWGFTRVGQWVFANGAELQRLYLQQLAWLEAQGFGLGDVAAAQFDLSTLLRYAQSLTGTARAFVTFMGLTLLFTLLGVLEVHAFRDRLARRPGETAAMALRTCSQLSRKLQTYMVVRTAMSLLTGLGVGLFAHFAGLALAPEWGVIAFALNYIPFIGPLAATLLPTALAGLQFGTWTMPVMVFLGMNAIQLAIGSYLEPRMTGAALSISAFAVLFAVFFWMLVWGVAGAFLGTPILIAILTACQQHPAGRWVPELLAGGGKERPAIRG